MYMSERETYDDNQDLMDGSISSGPVQHLKWAWFQEKMGVAEKQKDRVSTMSSEGNKNINTESPSQLRFIKA